MTPPASQATEVPTPIRIAVLGWYHEANTFSSVLADLDDYRSGGWHTGAEMVKQYEGSHSVVGGFLQSHPDEGDVEIVALPVANITPCGPVSAQAHDVLLGELVDALAKAGPVDAVLLVLHGAAVAEDDRHLDATIAKHVRAQVGSGVPIGTVLDMHANIEQDLVDAVDITLAYQTNPHVDAHRVAAECRRRIVEMARTGDRPVTVLEQLPLVVTIIAQNTSMEPLASLLELAERIEAEEGMVDLSLVLGFPYADVPQMGMSVLATHSDEAVARAAARRLAAAVWEAKHELQGKGTSVAEAVSSVKEHRGQAPLLLLDVGDNVGGGGPGDSTVVLAEAIARRARGAGTTLLDPAAVSRLWDVPPGGAVDVLAGGRSPEQTGGPVRLVGTVTGRHEGLYEEPGIAHGGFRFFDGGKMVGIRTQDDIHVVLTSRSVQPISATQYRVVGIEPTELRAIIGKGVNGPRAAFLDICSDLVVVDSSGVTRNSITEFFYEHRRRPMFPYEPETTYP